MSNSPVPVETENATENPTPLPKRRGRKRKSEIVLQKQLEKFFEDSVPREETLSRRGRPRKKVNYYELANPDNVDFPIENQKQTKYSLTEKKSSLEKDEEFIENATAEPINGDKEEVKELEDPIATTSTPKDNKRYNYTGETVKMMNTLFNLFTDDETPLNDSNNISKNGKRAHKKTKKEVKEEEIDDGSGNVNCAICNQTLDKNMWSHHKQRYHNNLAWRVGDPPLDLNDQSFVMHTLNALYKKKKPLYCDKCGEVKKSVVGFLSHRSQCLKSGEQLESVKVACEICGRKMLPVSMSTHMKMLHQNPSEKGGDEGSLREINEGMKPLPSKRSAAKKAMRIIENVTKTDHKEKYFTMNLDLGSQEFATVLLQKELSETQFIECKFRCNCITTNMEDALKHMEECTEKPAEGFICKHCLLVLTKLEDMIYHVEFTHDVNVTVDRDATEHSFSEKDGNKLPTFLFSNVRKTERVLFPFAFDWTYQFCEENYSNHILFTELSNSNWPLLPQNQAFKYLPTLNESCDVARFHVTTFTNVLKEDHTFRKFKLFDSEVYEDGKVTVFCGGPVSSIAWLPTPHTRQDFSQVLAVSVLNSPDAKYQTYENYHEDIAIQFWDFGVIVNKMFSLKEPKLGFSLTIGHGPVWHMEWCPSGCYGNGRMGLLAVAASDSVVYIYSVPELREGQMGLYYKPKPVMKLLLQRPNAPPMGKIKYYPTRISWSKAPGHTHIAVGYTNGFVALFNLKSDSFILKYRDPDGVPCVLPMKCFQAHSHTVTALALYHLNGGCRWLMTGSVDRGVSVWDLNNYSYPICHVKKNTVTDGFWLSNWLCYVTTFDEASTTMHVKTMLKQARDYIFDPNVTLTCSVSTITSVAGSDWLNAILHGNSVGEIIATFPHQLCHIPEHQKILKTKRMLFGYTRLLEKCKTPVERVNDDKLKKKTLQNLSTKKLSAGIKLSKIKADFDCDELFVNEPVIYEDAQQKYALLFCDNKMKNYDDFPKNAVKDLTALSKAYETMLPNQYPLSTINKIVFNPNRQASLYYATGYQAGFIRISWLEFLKNDNQIK